MDAEDLTRLERLRAEGTPGPWTVQSVSPGLHLVVTATLPGASAKCQEREDAALIVAAVNALPAIIAEVRRLRALPVVGVCWDCRHCDCDSFDGSDADGYPTETRDDTCEHEEHGRGERNDVDRDAPPPSWCPLRTAPKEPSHGR